MVNLPLQKTILTLRILYPVWMLFGAFSLLYVPSLLIVENDSSATAMNILQNQFLFRAGIVAGLFEQILFISAVLLLYKLFEDINKNQTVLMALLALVSVPIAMLNSLNLIAAINQLDNPSQMILFLNLHNHGISIASIFWGLWLFPLGYLIIKSNYFPKTIGLFVFIGGIGFSLGSILKLISPDFIFLISIFETMTFGEIAFILWLVIRGAKIPSAVKG